MTIVSDLTAVLLAGGKGARLRPFTEHAPKPLVPLLGRPLLGHLVTYLAHQGIRKVVVCTGYKAELIEEYVSTLDFAGSIQCVNSGDAAMANRLLDARKLIPGPALVCYADTMANIDLRALAEHHTALGRPATVTVHPLRASFGIVEIGNDNEVTALTEKPVLPYWINIGFALLEGQVLDSLLPETDLVQFFSALAAGGQLSAFQHVGKHLTVNTERERAEAESQIHFFTVQEGT